MAATYYPSWIPESSNTDYLYHGDPYDRTRRFSLIYESKILVRRDVFKLSACKKTNKLLVDFIGSLSSFDAYYFSLRCLDTVVFFLLQILRWQVVCSTCKAAWAALCYQGLGRHDCWWCFRRRGWQREARFQVWSVMVVVEVEFPNLHFFCIFFFDDILQECAS